MLKTRIMNDINRVAFPIYGSDCTSVLTYLLMLALALIVLRGLSTLSILKALRLTPTLSSSIVLS
jgi:hypothetical protein